ncbi:MAG TPA: DegT/DnrJ/EryC1/StrS family aminotransferase [Syntrophaceae bacterium]|nr:DegT/DnrJ/EryC1/StrS family aminotransferase [Syntrophaceae bacterium]
MGGSELIGKEEKAAVGDVLDRGVLLRYGFDAQRKGIYKVAEFERDFAKYMGIKYCQAVTSGTTALRTALAALGVGPGDEVITTAFTFVATYEAILETRAIPIPAEVDKSLNIDPADLEKKITSKTAAIIPVHMLGVPARMDEIMQIAGKHKIPVLEDSAQATGSSYKGRKTGTIGDMGIYSFDYVKTLTTGEGGMVVTDNEELYRRAEYFHDHGHIHNPAIPRGDEDRAFPGMNFRMDEMAGAMGVEQLKKLDYVLKRQRENKAQIKEGIVPLGFEFRDLPDPSGDGGDCLIFFLPSAAKVIEFGKSLGQQGIGTKILPSGMKWHFFDNFPDMMERRTLHREKCPFTCPYQAKEFVYKKGDLPKSKDLLERAIALGISVNMDDATITKVTDAVKSAAKEVR